jgi:hypothetical protein
MLRCDAQPAAGTAASHWSSNMQEGATRLVRLTIEDVEQQCVRKRLDELREWLQLAEE